MKFPKEERKYLGYIILTKNMPLPVNYEQIKLLPFDQGPINTAVEKPFRIWKSPIQLTAEEGEVQAESASLMAYQRLLLAALQTVRFAKGNFVLYVEQRQSKLDFELVGGLYKYA